MREIFRNLLYKSLFNYLKEGILLKDSKKMFKAFVSKPKFSGFLDSFSREIESKVLTDQGKQFMCSSFDDNNFYFDCKRQL